MVFFPLDQGGVDDNEEEVRGSREEEEIVWKCHDQPVSGTHVLSSSSSSSSVHIISSSHDHTMKGSFY